jgi:hypothetical protein
VAPKPAAAETTATKKTTTRGAPDKGLLELVNKRRGAPYPSHSDTSVGARRAGGGGDLNGGGGEEA